MNKKVNKKIKNSGFTLLIAVVTTALLLIVSFIIANIALKQIVLANAAKESQYSFYAADAGTECALYWDLKPDTLSAFSTTTPGSISCGGETISASSPQVSTVPPQATVVGGGGDSNPTSIFQLNLLKGCAIVRVTKSGDGTTSIDSRGYNSCDTSFARRYERGITLTYQGNLENVGIVGGGGPDTTPPTVLISSPTSGANVSGTTLITATASDDVGVASVQFKIDGVNIGSADTLSPYSVSWDTTSYSSGSHSITAVAVDTSNNTTTSSAVSVTVDNADVTSGLAGYWKLNESSGLSASDSSGNGKTGTLSGSPTPSWTTGKFNNSVSFNGSSNYVSVPSLALSNTNTVTYTAWIYSNATQNSFTGLVFSRNDPQSVGMNLSGSRNLGYTWNDNNINTWSWNSGLSIPTGSWTFVAIAISPTQAKAYVGSGGILSSAVNNITHITQNLNGTLRIGSDAYPDDPTNRIFNGKIDDVRIYNRTLSDTEIASIFAGSEL